MRCERFGTPAREKWYCQWQNGFCDGLLLRLEIGNDNQMYNSYKRYAWEQYTRNIICLYDFALRSYNNIGISYNTLDVNKIIKKKK